RLQRRFREPDGARDRAADRGGGAVDDCDPAVERSPFVPALFRPPPRYRLRAEEERRRGRCRSRRRVPGRALARRAGVAQRQLDEDTQPGLPRVNNNKILILGGGVAGCSMAYYLGEKGYEVTVLDKNSRVGGLARTCYYSGHPYEFGPHIWFWPGGKEEPINSTIVRLTNDELFYIDRRLFTWVEADNRKYRYPIHYGD